MLKLEPKTFMGERRRSWCSTDLCIDLSHYAAGCTLEKHRHGEAFFCFVLDGVYEEHATGPRQVLRPGSLVYHAAGCEHSNRWHEDGQCLHVEFAASFCEGANQDALSNPVPQIVSGRASHVVRNIYEELLIIDAASGIAFEGLTLMLLAETIREASRERKAPRWLLHARDRLQEEYVTVPSLRQIAVEAGVHPTYLAACFQQHFGVSISGFIRLRRIEQARELLARSDQPLGFIALTLGFADQSHFCRTFKKQTGLTPLEYRRLVAIHLPPVQES